MNALAAVGAVAGLGVAGLDPFGALIVVPALATGARRRIVLLFFGSALVTTVLTGVVLGESVQHLGAWLGDVLSFPDPVRLTAQLIVAALLAFWAGRRWARRHEPKPEGGKSRRAGAPGMLLLGVFWGVSALTDPSFFGVAAVGASMGSTFAVIAAFTGWFLVSQAPLCFVVLALVAGRDSKPVRRAIALADRLAGPAKYGMTLLLALAALVLILNGAGFLLFGSFWPI